MGMIYTLRIIPERLQPFIKYKRIKDFPGSRDLLVSLAWAWVIIVIPFLIKGTESAYQTVSILVFLIPTVFIRSVVFDIVSLEGDRIVGRETIPILIGQKRTRTMLLILAIITGTFIFLSAFFGLVPQLGYFLAIPPILMVSGLYVFQKRRMQASKLFEAVIDSNFIMTGVIAYIWKTL
jgi:4-hydroxy-3-methylbut-2-enyl diphosphate reductase